MRDARLMNAAGDRVGDQFLVPLAPGAAVINLRDRMARGIEAVGIDAGKRADGAGSRPGSRAFAIRYRYALAALDERQHFAPRYHQGNKRSHKRAPLRAAVASA